MKGKIQKTIFENLEKIKEREKDVLIARFGLTGEPSQTLEDIGRKYGITRERVRQIVNTAIKRLAKIKNHNLDHEINFINSRIKQQGGLFAENKLSAEIFADKSSQNTGLVAIICRLNPNLKRIKKTNYTEAFWANKYSNLEKILSINKKITQILLKVNKTTKLSEIFQNFKSLYPKIKISQEILNSIILGSKNILEIPSGKFGLTSWPKINPKNTKDKIYYILSKNKKPIHFLEIAKLISEKKFTTKNPTPATVHNELISDNRFVLIGKGIYALKKWGYQKGTVAEIIREFLKQQKRGLNREKIINYVLKNRIVSKNTIIMNLNANRNFQKIKPDLWVYRK